MTLLELADKKAYPLPPDPLYFIVKGFALNGS